MASAGPISRAVTNALKDAPLLPRDAAAVALAKRYAAAIDEASALADALDDLPYDEDMAKRVNALAAKVDAQTVLDTLGPKLLAALVQLSMTPGARGVKGGAQGAAPVTGKLDELRARRQRRTG